MNYQKELDKLIVKLDKRRAVCQNFCCTVAVHHAAVMCWNI